MSQPTLSVVRPGDQPPLAAMIRSWRLQIDAEDKSPKTIETYVESVEQFARFLVDHGRPTSLGKLRRDDVDAFSVWLRDERGAKEATRHIRLRSVRSFLQWAVAEKEIETSPMAGMKLKAPKEQPVPVLTEPQLRKLLSTVDGGTYFEQRRDAAIMRIFIDTGARRAEVAGLRYHPAHDKIDEVNDVAADRSLVRVMGKGGYQRVLPLGKKAARALDRYLRVRSDHAHAHLRNLWIARKGSLSDGGIAQMIERRSIAAGLGKIHPHQLRHSMIHDSLAHGMAEGDLMRITGHRSRKMLDRYGSALAVDRAIAAHRLNSPGDRI